MMKFLMEVLGIVEANLAWATQEFNLILKKVNHVVSLNEDKAKAAAEDMAKQALIKTKAEAAAIEARVFRDNL